ncbi:tyrosine phosphatase-like protein [Aspergillus unguis]
MSSQSSVSKIYLFLYNTLSSLLWLRILLTVLASFLYPTSNSDFNLAESIYTALEPQVRWTQTIAIIEILHAATGLTRSPVFTTFTQIFARSVQVWAINYAYPDVTASSVAYPAMLFAWASADTVRYFYFAVLGTSLTVPGSLRWLRYSLFIVLYPIGIASEWWLMYRAVGVTSIWAVAGIFYFFLGLYAPGKVL